MFYYYDLYILLYIDSICNIAIIRISLLRKILIIENLRLSFLARYSTPYFHQATALASQPFLFAFFWRGASDRAVIARECIHRGGAVFYFCIERETGEHVLHPKPWPESLVIRSTVSSLNEVR